jgi:hypothetical protein
MCIKATPMSLRLMTPSSIIVNTQPFACVYVRSGPWNEHQSHAHVAGARGRERQVFPAQSDRLPRYV